MAPLLACLRLPDRPSASIGYNLPATQGEGKREVKKVGILVVLANVGLRELAQNRMLFNALYMVQIFVHALCSLLV